MSLFNQIIQINKTYNALNSCQRSYDNMAAPDCPSWYGDGREEDTDENGIDPDKEV